MESAIILAGGRSTRMGVDKAALELAGRPLLQHVIEIVSGLAAEVIVVTRPRQQLPALPDAVRVVEDAIPDKGPLAGLLTGLEAASAFPALAVACDMPLLKPALLHRLVELAADHAAVVPVRGGLPEPLCAVYGAGCVEAIRRRLARDELKMTGFLGDVDTLYVSETVWHQLDPEGASFLNINTPADLESAAAVISGRG